MKKIKTRTLKTAGCGGQGKEFDARDFTRPLPELHWQEERGAGRGLAS